MTAFFSDLVGSTAFAERIDAEAVRAGLAPYFELLQSTIDDQAGTFAKLLRDGVFALFGVPEVAEDDALRAVKAAAELQRRFRSFADGIRERHGVELGLRVGVNTGELVVGVDDVDLVGDRHARSVGPPPLALARFRCAVGRQAVHPDELHPSAVLARIVKRHERWIGCNGTTESAE